MKKVHRRRMARAAWVTHRRFAMKHRLLTTLLTCACLVSVSAVSAQGRGNGPQGHGGPSNDYGRPGNGPGGHGPQRGPDRYDRHDRYDRFDQRVNDRNGYGPQRWNRGDRLPMTYRSRQYVVNDWRGYRLAPPPRGQQWVAVGADYFLVGIATGLIAQAVFGR